MSDCQEGTALIIPSRASAVGEVQSGFTRAEERFSLASLGQRADVRSWGRLGERPA